MAGHGCRVFKAVVSEAYTSKTCGQCGNVKSNLGDATTYTCSTCGLVVDRDMLGARNVYCLRNAALIGLKYVLWKNINEA